MKPWKAVTFKFSTDPALIAKVTDVLDCSWRATAECDRALGRQNPQLQALNRTEKTLPMQPGHPEQRTTTTSGTAHIVRRPGHRHRTRDQGVQELAPASGFLAFLNYVARAYPEGQLHLFRPAD